MDKTDLLTQPLALTDESGESAHGLTPSLEMYLKAVFQLGDETRSARVSEIAQALGVSMPSVHGALQKLIDKGCVRHRRYRGVELTTKGRRIAVELTQKWELLARFFADVLAVDPAVARADACRMEHVVSAETLTQLLRFVEFTDRCTEAKRRWLHNFATYARTGKIAEPCPGCDGECRLEVVCRPDDEALIPLSLLRPGQGGKVARIRGAGAASRRMQDLGLVPGTRLEVVRVAPLGDPLEVKARRFKLTLRREEAARVLMERT